jgi:hypothetical protein
VVLGLFGSKVERLKKAVRQRYGQHDPRKDAMIRLLQMGDLEAYRAVLSRFTVNCDSPHWDEKEKTWLAQRLVERAGDAPLLQALEELLMSGERLNQVLWVAQRLMDRNHYQTQVEAAFEKRLGDHRAADTCVELIAAMGDLDAAVVRRCGLAAVLDRTDEVILAGLNILERTGAEEIAEVVYSVAFDSLQMPRVVRRAGQVIVAMGLVDPESRTELSESLAEDFTLQGGRLVARS